MILRAPFLDFNCLFPKPIMAENVLAIREHIFGINYPRICVDAKQGTFLNRNWTDCSPASLIPYYNPRLELIYQRLISSFTNIYIFLKTN